METSERSQSPELKMLGRLAGTWDTTGTLFPDGKHTAFSGTDRYEWFPGGFFLVHTVDVTMGGVRQQTLEVIGFDALSGSYPMHFYDNQGESGLMHGFMDGDQWIIRSPELRFEGTFSDNDRTLSGVWEQLDGAQWTHLMTIRLQKKL